MEFYNPVRILAGHDGLEKLALYLEETSREKKILLLTRGMDFSQSPAGQALRKALAGRDVREEELTLSNPDVADMAAMLERVGGEPYGLILAVGGGSVMDTAKTLALAIPAGIRGTEGLRAFIAAEAYEAVQPIPWIGVPTTSGTGSEVTPWATVWDRERECKMSCSYSHNFAALAVVDPVCTATCPAALTISSALDALCHSTESFWACRTNEVSQTFALLSIGLIRRHLEDLAAHPDDAELRLLIGKASLYAGLAFSNTKTTVCHSVSYPMTERFGVPHGTAAALTLGDFMDFNKAVIPRYAELLEAYQCASAAEVKDWVFHMLSLGGFALRLRDYGIGSGDISYIVGHAFTKGRADNNPVAVQPEDVQAVLERIF